MEKYCLKDINWIYTEDGKFVTPFIFNRYYTKIKDLENDEIIELPDTPRTTFDKIASIYAETLKINENSLIIRPFSRLIKEGTLSLKGIKNLKYLSLLYAIRNGGYAPDLSSYIVTEEDIHKFTRAIIQKLNPKTKKEKESEKLSSKTKAF